MSMRAFRLGEIVLVTAIAGGATAALAGGCKGEVDVHSTPEAKSKPCIGCHSAAYQAARNPVHVGVMPETCNECHDTRAWVPAAVTPEKHPWFPLQNKHARACADCHTKGYRPGDTSKECVSCHQKQYDGAQNPSHRSFPTDCKVCHNDMGWRPSIFTHPWPLTSKHATTLCTNCHKASGWAGVPTDCTACHQKDYDAAQNPIHAPIPPTGGMLVAGGRTCADCHTSGGGTPTGGWRPTTFVHPTAPFELTGAHANPARVTCNDCHQAPKPAGTPARGYDAKTFVWTKCIDCHADRFNSATPSHAGFPTECRMCHDTLAWSGATAHPEAKFPLQAGSAHQNVACVDCHDATRGSSKGGANTNCVTCHGFAGGVWNAVHGEPRLDQRHGFPACAANEIPGGSTTCFPNATQATATPNVCRACHPSGEN